MSPSRSIVIRSPPVAARWTVGGSAHAGHVPFLERDPLDGVEVDAELVGHQGTDPDGGRRGVGADADAAAGQAGWCDPAALAVADEMRQRIAAEDDDRQQAQRHVA